MEAAFLLFTAKVSAIVFEINISVWRFFFGLPCWAMETVSFPFYQQFLAYDPFSKGRLLFAKVATGGSGSFKSDFVRKHNLKLSSAGYEYVPAQLVESKSWWYIEFYVWDVQKEQLVRKRVGAGRAGSIRERRKKALLKVAQINALLVDGYAIDVSKQVAPSPIGKAVSLGEALATGRKPL